MSCAKSKLSPAQPESAKPFSPAPWHKRLSTTDSALSKADGSYPKTMKKLIKTQLLVLGDFGLAPLTDPERRDLLEVIEDRNSAGFTLITSQLPIENWHEHIGHPTIADASLTARKKLKLDSG